jgi:hypothetical protein
MQTSKDIVSDNELEVAFLGTNFGSNNHRKLLEASVLKKAIGYHCGWTITQIMIDLKLINKKYVVLSKGRRLLQTMRELDAITIVSG